jgi:hypothetical protein
MRTRSLILGGALAGMLGCSDGTLPSGPAAASPAGDGTPSAVTDSVVLVVAGDMHANCKSGNQSRATAALVEQRFPGARVIVVGDNAGKHGTAAEYQCFDQAWGRFKDRTWAVIGNHELNQDTAGTAHYDYFNGVGVDSGRAGYRGRGYYTMDYGAWRIFVANSHRDLPAQTAWMTRVMAASPRQCTMALWHSPRFTSNASVLPFARARAFWEALYNGGADVVIGGHAHVYERFAEMRPDGVVDTRRGLRQFVVGTGGGNLYGFLATPHPASVSRVNAWGVLRLTLYPTRYRWAFYDRDGVIRDSGSDSCD